MRNFRGSILIVVLVMIFILSFISVAMLNFTYFYFSDTSVMYERTKLRLITEYETFRLIKLLMSGQTVTNAIFTNTNTDNFCYTTKITLTNYNNIYKYTLILEGAKVKKMKREIAFSILYPTDFCYLNMSKIVIPEGTKGALWGYIFLKEFENKSSDFLLAFKYPPIFSDSTNLKMTSFIGDANISESDVSASINVIAKTNAVTTVNINVNIDAILDKSLAIADKDWIIREYNKDFEIERIVNPFITEKEYLGIFSYSKPYLRLPSYIKVENVYFSEVRRNAIDPIESSDTIGSRGEYTLAFISMKDGNLWFNTQPVEIKLPPESFDRIFKIRLNVPNTRIMSKYRKVVGIYLDNTNINLLLDNKVSLNNDVIEILDGEVKSEYYLSLGKGNGIKKEFRLPKDVTPQIVFVGNKKVENTFVENFNLILPYPPSMNEEVVVLKKIPKVYIQKSYPRENLHIYTDKNEYAVVIDFDKINNLPKTPIIFSYLPLVIKGTPNEPIIVVSKDNIYIDSVNTDPLRAKTMVIISGKGVFVKEYVEVLRNVFIASKLDGVYRLSPLRIDDMSTERGMWIFGSVFLEGVLRNKSSTQEYYLASPENPFNNKTIVLSRKVAEDYFSQTAFGETFRKLFQPFIIINKISQ